MFAGPSPDGERWNRLPLVTLLGVALLLLAGIAVAAQAERSYRSERLNEAVVQARMLASAVTEPLEFEDTAAARDSVHAMGQNSEIETAGVYGADGLLIAGYARKDASVPRALGGRYIVGADRVAAVADVTRGDRRLGQVLVSTDLDAADRRVTRYGGIAILAVMGSLVVLVLGVAQAAMRRVNAALSTSNDQLRAEAAERAQAEAALRQAQKMQAVGQLTGGIAHDFNNLLTPITGGLEFVLTRLEAGPAKSIAENALEAARRGARLTGQLLAFSRVQRLSVSPVAVNAVIEGMRSLLSHTIGAEVTIRLNLDPSNPRALCDANQIENAIINLAINARDAMTGGGTLTITTDTAAGPAGPDAEGDTHVSIAVSDTGGGMTPEVQARAAEPFFTTKPMGKGTGLGLAQVYGIAHQYGGLLEIDSRLGEGTTVRILLPEAAAEAASLAPESEPGVPVLKADGHAADILLVDDDDEVRAFVAATLEALGYRVRAASDGESGLELLDARAPDLLLVDYAMGGMNGAEMARLARERRPGLPIIVVSGYADTAVLDTVLGPDVPVLRKPFGIDALVKVLDSQLGRHG